MEKRLCLNFTVMMIFVYATVFLCSCKNLYRKTNRGVNSEAQKVLESVIEANGGVEPDMNDTRPRYQICRDTFYAVIFHNTIYVNTEGEGEEMRRILFIRDFTFLN